MSSVTDVDTELVRAASVLRQRARSLRDQARFLSPLLANAYRRRASELELEAWLGELQAGVPCDDLHPAA